MDCYPANTFPMRKRIIAASLPYLPAGKGTTDEEMRQWIEGHYERVTTFFRENAPNQFLEIWLEDEPHIKIADFLKCPVGITMPRDRENIYVREDRCYHEPVATMD